MEHFTIRVTQSRHSIDDHDPYLDHRWTPIVGPTAIWLLRQPHQLARQNTHPPTSVSLHALATRLNTKDSRIHSALARLNRHHLIIFNPPHIAPPNALATITDTSLNPKPSHPPIPSRSGYAEARSDQLHAATAAAAKAAKRSSAGETPTASQERLLRNAPAATRLQVPLRGTCGTLKGPNNTSESEA